MWKHLLTALLILNLLVEWMAAATLIGGPGGIPAVSAQLGNMWSMHYGFGAFAIGSIGAWAFRFRSDLNVVTVVVGTLATFHVGVLASLYMAGDQQAGVVIHTVLAVLSLLVFVQRRRCIGAA